MLARLWYSRGMRRDVPILSHKPVTRSRDELIARWSVLALMAVGLAYTAALVAGIAPDNFDAHSYWMADLADPYARSRVGTDYAYLYSPAFAQAIEPLRWLPWTIAGAIWTIGLFGLLGWTAGRLGLVLLLFQPVVASIALGNVEIPIAAAIVAGFRWPAAWSFVLLSKVTPGIGLLWFAVRREWRPLVIALGVTAAISAASFVLAPHLWFDWFDVLFKNRDAAVRLPVLPGPIWLRVLIAAAIVIWGARTNRRWAVPVAAGIAMPVGWFTFTVVIVVGIAGLLVRDPEWTVRGTILRITSWMRRGRLPQAETT